MQEVADVQELRLRQLEDISTSLFEGQYKLGRALTDQGKQLTSINSRLNRIENRMDGLETRMDGLETRMERVETLIANLTELVTLALDDLAFIKNSMRPGEWDCGIRLRLN